MKFVTFCIISALILCISANNATISKRIRLSYNTKRFTLKLHNDLRSQVSSGAFGEQPAKNLSALKWDEKLASQAKSYSENCTFSHSRIKGAFGYASIGENLAAGTLNKPLKNEEDFKKKIASAFNNWSKEANFFSFPNNCSGVCAHYTQLVWANTTHVGCGVSECEGLNGWDIGDNLAYYLVCNYGPGGNYIGEAPYAIS